ncbi:MAG: DUF503 domain-containing protein [Gemmatimonadetes bacterium]|jgi:uncharacterized protein|nr:DUF503 domain-containing protein [Gemmatimonadota bacterium]MBT6146462.1 DUF503 domain-containing protein [Gemmatimonadota bacterium]MBT7859197.1 DUF503 domain-containing protein [Gemmatimonadota bacterium]
MVVIVSELQLHFPEAQSLKQKRQVLKSVKDRLHQRYNLSVAEVDHQDLWQRCTLAMAMVSNDGRHADEVMSKAIHFVEQDLRLQVLSVDLEER